MDFKIEKCFLPFGETQTEAFLFFPLKAEIKGARAIFGHGYTSHKGDLLNWASRLAEEGIPVALFDWPGHYLGNFSEVTDFEFFKSHAVGLFESAYSVLPPLPPGGELILGGHSLGALLSLYAMNLGAFTEFSVRAIGVGLGVSLEPGTHLFQSKFFEKTMNVRRQLVSEALGPDNMFPWIREMKMNLPLLAGPVHLITGEDDAVVGQNGSENLVAILEKAGNKVTLEKPKRLSHHQPEMAAPFIFSHVKKLDHFL